jgi:hypothetical protein
MWPPLVQFANRVRASLPEKDDPKFMRLVHHVISGCREVGVLLIAFRPLEATLNSTAGSAARNSPGGLLFFSIGVALFLLALLLEWRLFDVR